MTTRRTAIFGCFMVYSVAFGQNPPKPNVVIFFTDDQSWDSIGFAGGDVFTPMKDSLSSEGITFTNAHVPTTVCSPSRYSLLTGKYPGRCSADRFMNLFPPNTLARIENNVELTKGEWHLGNLLQQLGYKTGFVGKSHIMEHIVMNNTNNWHRLGLKTYPANEDPKYNEEVNDMMKYNHNIYRNIVMSYGFDYADGIYMGNLAHLNNQHLNVHNLEWTIGKALDFIELEKDNPFFLYFSTTLNHGPFPWAFNNGVYPNSFSADPGYTGEGYVSNDYAFMPSRSDILTKTTQAGYPEQTAYTLWMDEGVRAIYNQLKDLEILDNTIIIFLPDHGSWRHGKATCYDFGLKVPCFFYWKGGIQSGTVYDGLISSLDFAPTFLELAGHNRIDTLEFDGKSLYSLLKYGDGEGHTSLYGELGFARSVKTTDWKYIAVRYPDDIQSLVNEGSIFPSFQDEIIRQPYLTANAHLGYHAARHNPLYFETDQLFDLQSDPEETINVFDQYPDVVKQMKTLLSKHLVTFDNRPFGEFALNMDSTPYPARFPNPLNKKTEISKYTVLGWKSEMNATSHRVFFGKTNPPEFQAEVSEPIYDPGVLDDHTIYYWRIDEVNENGVTTGERWSFTTSGNTLNTTMEPAESNKDIRIFPNPNNTGNFYIDHDGIDPQNVIIYHIDGRKANNYQVNRTGDGRCVISGLSAGCYILTISNTIFNESFKLIVLDH